MHSIKINASKAYTVHIGDGLLECAGELTAAGGVCRAAVVTDDLVAPLYAKKLEDSLSQSGFSVCRFVFPHGERSKNISSLTSLLNFFAEEHLTRTDAVIALGGGVTGDLAGFAASVYLRGIRLVQIPTTLLAAVDSSVGGKTAVNLDAGKNLAGSFYQPELVICDCSLLSDLPQRVFADGCAEVIKYGVTGDAELFQFLCEKNIRDNPEYIVSRCVLQKRALVCADEYDRGERALLNFGHTAGHAIEKCSGYEISHGEAVGIGMLIAAHGAYVGGFCGEDFSPDIKRLLIKNSLPTLCPFTAQELYNTALADKKMKGNTITLVLPEKIGHCVTRTIPADDLAVFFEKGLDF